MKSLHRNKKGVSTAGLTELDYSVLNYEELLAVNGAGGSSGGGTSGGPSGSSSSTPTGSGLSQEWINSNVPDQYKPAAEAALQRQNEEKAGVYGAPTDSRRITTGIGEETNLQNNHTGVDIGATNQGVKGDPIYAVADGTIKRNGTTTSGSTRVEQSLPYTNDTAVYQHADFIVKEGDTVRRGDIIGYMSDNGTPGQVHLHYEIRKDGEYAGGDASKIVNPLDHMPSDYYMAN